MMIPERKERRANRERAAQRRLRRAAGAVRKTDAEQPIVPKPANCIFTVPATAEMSRAGQ